MKNKIVILVSILAFAFAFLLTHTSHACTDFIVKAKDGTVVNARSMEFAEPMDSLLIVHPRGELVQSAAPNKAKGFSWTTRYGYVSITSMGKAGPNDGMNEKGLSFGFLWYPGTVYPNVSVENNGHAVEIMDMASWLLGNHASVDEVKTSLKDIVVWGNRNPILKAVPPLHIALHDASGKNLVIEFVDGQMNVHDNPVGVLTNAPSFTWQITNLRNYANLTAVDVPPIKINGFTLYPTGHGAGVHGLPGDATPPSRFIRTVFNTQLSAPVENASSAVNLAQHILNAVDIPLGSDRLNSKTMKGDYTQWAIIKDMTNKILYYRSYEDMSLRKIDINKLDLATGAASVSIKVSDRSSAVNDVTSKLK